MKEKENEKNEKINGNERKRMKGKQRRESHMAIKLYSNSSLTLLHIKRQIYLHFKHMIKELGKFSDNYIKLFGGTDRFEELRMSLLVNGLTKVCNLCFDF